MEASTGGRKGRTPIPAQDSSGLGGLSLGLQERTVFPIACMPWLRRCCLACIHLATVCAQEFCGASCRQTLAACPLTSPHRLIHIV